jgi:hypothetical protein
MPFTSVELLVNLGCGVSMIAATVSLYFSMRKERRAAEGHLNRVFEQVDLSLCELRDLQTTIVAMESQLAYVAERAEAESRRAPTPAAAAPRGYDIAARLAKNGASGDELVSSCGITRHEAELLVRLHGKQAASEAVVNAARKEVNLEKPLATAPAPAAVKPAAEIKVEVPAAVKTPTATELKLAKIAAPAVTIPTFPVVTPTQGVPTLPVSNAVFLEPVSSATFLERNTAQEPKPRLSKRGALLAVAS